MGVQGTEIISHDRTKEQLEQEPSGTGAFRLQEYRPGEQLVLSRNEAYWLPDYPYIDEFHLLVMPERATQIAALMNGEIDWVPEVWGKTYRPYKRKLILFSEPDLPLSLGYMAEASFQASNWSDPHLDELIIQARGTQGVAERQALYTEVQELIIQEDAVIIPYVPSLLMATRTKVQGLVAPSLHIRPEEVWL